MAEAGGTDGNAGGKKTQQEEKPPVNQDDEEMAGGDQSSDDAADEKKKREKKQSAKKKVHRTRYHDKHPRDEKTDADEKTIPTRKRHRPRDGEQSSDDDGTKRTAEVAPSLAPSPLDPPWSAERKRMSSECRAFGVCTRAIKSLADLIADEMPTILSEPNRTSVKVFLIWQHSY